MAFINFREKAIHVEICLLLPGYLYEQKILVTRMSPNEKSVSV